MALSSGAPIQAGLVRRRRQPIPRGGIEIRQPHLRVERQGRYRPSPPERVRVGRVRRFVRSTLRASGRSVVDPAPAVVPSLPDVVASMQPPRRKRRAPAATIRYAIQPGASDSSKPIAISSSAAPSAGVFIALPQRFEAVACAPHRNQMLRRAPRDVRFFLRSSQRTCTSTVRVPPANEISQTSLSSWSRVKARAVTLRQIGEQFLLFGPQRDRFVAAPQLASFRSSVNSPNSIVRDATSVTCL